KERSRLGGWTLALASYHPTRSATMIAVTMRLLILLIFASTLFAQATYDLLLKGGHLIDSKNKIDSVRDLAIRDGKVAAVGVSIPATQARKVVNVAGLYVIPGLIDLHAHVFS